MEKERSKHQVGIDECIGGTCHAMRLLPGAHLERGNSLLGTRIYARYIFFNEIFSPPKLKEVVYRYCGPSGPLKLFVLQHIRVNLFSL